MKLGDFLTSIAQDTRHTLHGFVRSPGFAFGIIATLGLGMGAATAIFTVMDALLLRPLPYHEPHRIVEISRLLPGGGNSSIPDWLPPSEAQQWIETRVFDEVALRQQFAPVRTDGEPESLRGLAVSPSQFPLLGIAPATGRGILPEDARPGARPVVILAYEYWVRIGADTDIIGRTIELSNRAATVIGVMPKNVRYPIPGSADVFVALATDHTVLGAPADRVQISARLRPGEDVAAAQARADAVEPALARGSASRYGWKTKLTPETAWRANPADKKAVWMLGGAVIAMLLISAVNGTNLLLARATARSREMTVRLAIGASRARLVRQLLTESLVLGLLSGIAAVLVADWGVVAMRELIPSDIRFATAYAIEIQMRVLTFAFLLSLATGFAFGILPAVQAARAGAALLPGMNVYAAGSRRAARVRSGLVVFEIGLSITLLAVAGLFGRSFLSLLRADTGYVADELVLLSAFMPEHAFANGVTRMAFMRELEARIEALPGVAGAVIADGVPPNVGFSFDVALEAEGSPGPAQGQPTLLPTAYVEPAFFDVLGTRIVEGRAFTEEDSPATDAVIIDRPMARFLWGSQNAVGKRFRLSSTGRWRTVIGVVEDVRLRGPDDRMGNMDMFRPLQRDSIDTFASIAIRAHGRPADLIPAIRAAFRDLAPAGLPVYQLQTVRDGIIQTIQMPRFLSALLLVFSGVALALAIIGVYGVLSFMVQQRSREIAIRVAVGASAARVRGLVLTHGIALGMLGAAIGLVGAVAASRVIGSLLFDVKPSDPATLLAVTALMLAAAAVAAYMPARRSTRVEPMMLLKSE